MPLVVTTGYEVTLRQIADLGQERDRLTLEKADAEANHLGRIATVYESGAIDMDGLVAAYYEYRQVADPGFSHRWDAAIAVTSAEIVGYARSRPHRQPNGPGGSWSGPHPFDEGPTPGDATPVAYMLYDHLGKVCYVGSTGGFRGRINCHARDGKRFTSWRAYPCSDRDAAYALEMRLIRKHQPYLNKRSR
jgi:hypothetical protein